jgi:hypothetical protein
MSDVEITGSFAARKEHPAKKIALSPFRRLLLCTQKIGTKRQFIGSICHSDQIK